MPGNKDCCWSSFHPNPYLFSLLNMSSHLDFCPRPQLLVSSTRPPWGHILENLRVIWPWILPNCQGTFFPLLQHQNLIAQPDYNQYVTIPQGSWGCLWLGLLPPTPNKQVPTPSNLFCHAAGNQTSSLSQDEKIITTYMSQLYGLAPCYVCLHELSHLMIPVIL